MECSFCGRDIKSGQGILYAKRDGSLYYFCGSKCKINLLKLKRKPSKKKWVRKNKKK